MTQAAPMLRPHTDTAVESSIMRLAREASIEINVQDLEDLQASRSFLPPGCNVFVTLLPKQAWDDSVIACRAVSEAGFAPVPHVPVRLVSNADTLERMLNVLRTTGAARDVLLLSGDYPHPRGPYSRVEDVLNTGALQNAGLQHVSFAGHPEGHPLVALDEIRRAELAKAQGAASSGLNVRLVSQFFFEAQPFLQWARDLRCAGASARIIAGLAGPTNLATLFRFAVRCGAGPSIRALGSRPTAFAKLLREHGPENVLRQLAQAHSGQDADFAGIHMFCFGGFLRTCEWLHRVAQGNFAFNDSGGFDVK